MSGVSRTRAVTIGAVILVVSVIVASFALGGNGSSSSGGSSGGESASSAAVGVAGRPEFATAAGSSGGESSATKSTAAGGSNGTAQINDAVSSLGVTATRVVKTGSLSLTVKKGLVATTITNLTGLTSRLGGYVSQSRTDSVDGAPAGSVTLRIPANNFDTAVNEAAHLGHEVSLSTSAHDVTGKYVDLAARASALKRTRSTYLTILSGARTIAQTLSVQQRVNDIQEQIEALQGQLKVLRNQSNDGTLSVDVTEAGSPVTTPVHHERHGFAAAWHNSTHRFNRGLQGIIGVIGPLLLAFLVLGVLYAILRVGLRRTKGVTT